VPGAPARDALERRLAAAGVGIERSSGSFAAMDPWGIAVRVAGA
jgi:hypothetical protein